MGWQADGTFCFDVNEAYFLFGQFCRDGEEAMDAVREAGRDVPAQSTPKGEAWGLRFTALVASICVVADRPANRYQGLLGLDAI